MSTRRMREYAAPCACGGRSQVINSRPTQYGVDRILAVIRRRRCLTCGSRWSTIEITEEQVEKMNRARTHLATLLATIIEATEEIRE